MSEPRNVLPEPQSTPAWSIFLSQFKSSLITLLLVAAAVSLLAGETLDTILILAITLANAGIGFYQEIKAKDEIAALKKLVVDTVRVVRDGLEQRLETKFLTEGDLVILSEGDKIPADGSLLTSHNLTVSEASLTGESVPVEKNPSDEVFMATTILTGNGQMQVTKIGSATKFGQIALSLTNIPEEKTPLEIKIADLGKKLTLLVALIIALVEIIGLFQGRDPHLLFFSAVALAVAAIPEGLPAVLTISLAVGVRRLAQRRAIVKRLVATEALGSVDVILTDKTGTLTKNEMTVKKILTADQHHFSVSGVGYTTVGEITETSPHPKTDRDNLDALVKAGVFCNRSSLAPVVDGGRSFTVLGDTTEGALLILAEKAGLDHHKLRLDHPISDEIPFDSARRLMTVVVEQEIYTKGAPEEVLKICSDLSASEKETFLHKSSELAARGYRLLALATKHFSPSLPKKDFEKDLTFLGLVAISDPPRPEAASAITACRRAGITVVMVTGDSLESLLAAGQEEITGPQLNTYSDEVLAQNLLKIGVFARVTPEDKLRIVEAFQNLGKVVAVTGDGVNDSPALKKAQVGVAMGITGTDVAKEASDLIITDDNFATIVSAIEEGRVIFLNLTKTIKYLLSCNLGEITTVFLAMLIGLPLPLSPLAILWMNIVTDGLPALALAIDPKDGKTLHLSRRELQIGQGLLDQTSIRFIILLGFLLGSLATAIFFLFSSFGQETARLATFTFLVAGQTLIAFLLRGKNQPLLSNRLLLAAAFLAAFFQILIILVPSIRSIFV
ncbi:MAG: ATPase [Microgenomates group bacterium GW2011_GWA1_48_10]|nr:MAG: ATPase [Microgenomates group bacterium GW2011_GWA1_48_10]